MGKIAVHLHLFYLEQLDDLLVRLQNLADYPYDLFVTMVDDNAEAKQKILTFKSDAKIWIVPNLGYDVGPFIDFLHKINLNEYDYIIKIHTKRAKSGSYCIFNRHHFDMKTWRAMLLDAVISKSAVANNLRLLMQNDKIGMVSSEYVLTNEKWAYQNVMSQIETEMVKIGMEIPKDKHFVAGTMFWARAKLLKPFLVYKIENFAVSEGQIHDGTLAHVIERMFGLVITAQGYQVRGVFYKKYLLNRFIANFKRFIFQKKLTRQGNEIIKICKIPVYHRKEIL
ncbi:MAG: hypothetical protein J6N45_01970 [Alphaproteobacteria bacterium]|nr:hypothetical protein [Alphaproteobacteria bacterium]